MKHWVDTWDIKNDVKKCQDRATWGVHTQFPLRLDYVICSQSLKDRIVDSQVDQSFEGSDHVPIGTRFNIYKND